MYENDAVGGFGYLNNLPGGIIINRGEISINTPSEYTSILNDGEIYSDEPITHGQNEAKVNGNPIKPLSEL